MTLQSACLFACMLVSSIAAAQNVPVIQNLQVAPRPVTAATEIDQEAMERTRLERENARLKEENAALKQRIEALTSLGGSEVRAYCAAPNVSKNTAGAEKNCAEGGYSCDDVTGLCNTQCSTSAQCSGNGYSCHPESHTCTLLPPSSD